MSPVNTATLKWDGKPKALNGVGTSWSTVLLTPPGDHSYEIGVRAGPNAAWTFSVVGGAANVNGNSQVPPDAGKDGASDDVTV